MKTSLSFKLILACLLTAAAPLFAQSKIEFRKPDDGQIKQAAALGLPTDGKVRIIFKRVAGALGAIVPHMIVDCGDSISHDIFIQQIEKYADFDGNFDKAGNVQQVYLMDEKMNFQLIQGGHSNGDKLMTADDQVIKKDLVLSDLLLGSKNHEIKVKGYWISSEHLKTNGRIEGFVKSGQTIGWDRAPGKVRIVVIVPNGDQGFCPAFKAEPGHVYFIDYYYMKAKFVISDLK
jgi:hypothetical protein